MDGYDLRYAMDEAYEAGACAGYMGKPQSDNPHQPGELFDCWRDGWLTIHPEMT